MTFETDPLSAIDAELVSGQDRFWLPGRQLLVAEPTIAREILRNARGLYAPHSDFFDTDAGTFGPRDAQIALANAARTMLERQLAQSDIAALVQEIGASSEWPRMGVSLLEKLVGPLIAKPSRSPRFRAALREVIDVRIADRTPEARRTLARFLRRFRYIRAFSKERAAYSATGEPEDLFDAAMLHGVHAPDEQLLEVYSGFVFAILGSVGLALGWSVLLAIENRMTGENPRHLVSEALRMYPIAWLLARAPTVTHDVLGETVNPGDAVVVSPYAIGRNPRVWNAAQTFAPRRWEGNPDRSGWLPFGAGPHMCVAISLSVDLVSAILTQLFVAFDARVEVPDPRPVIGASLSPPRFTLRLVPRGA